MPIIVRLLGCITSMLIGLLASACDRAPASSTSGGTTSPQPDAAAPARVGSCDRASSTGTCSEYIGAYLAQNEILLTSSCARLGGTFVYAECPNTSVIGACTLSTGEVRKFYGTGASAYDSERAQKECATSYHGAWTPR